MVIDQATREKWARHLQRLKESGVDRREYCRQHGIKDHQLRWWSGRLAMKRKATKAKAFVRVVVDDAADRKDAAVAVAARLVLAGGGAIEFSTHADPAWIARLAREVTQ